MKTWFKLEMAVILSALLISMFDSCKEKDSIDTSSVEAKSNNIEIPSQMAKNSLSEDFKKYWYAGNAEITSYNLEQARYGEIREGNAVLIFVTEPFLADKQVKADGNNESNVPVLKLNSTKKYLTGIYPYSIMTSSFYPVYDNQHAIKVSFSAQEWCGHVYAQLNNRENFEIISHSYFEKEADQNFKIDKVVLEDELWNKLRINPDNLPLGNITMLPSFEYIRLSHNELRPYNAIATLNSNAGISTYSISFPELERILEINFSSKFPYIIEGWAETSKSGFGDNAILLTSKAIKIKTLRTPYWRQNGNKDLPLRDSLGI